jgi:hypothetical protein
MFRSITRSRERGIVMGKIPDIYWEEKAKLTGTLALQQLERGESDLAVLNLKRMAYALSQIREESQE